MTFLRVSPSLPRFLSRVWCHVTTVHRDGHLTAPAREPGCGCGCHSGRWPRRTACVHCGPDLSDAEWDYVVNGGGEWSSR